MRMTDEQRDDFIMAWEQRAARLADELADMLDRPSRRQSLEARVEAFRRAHDLSWVQMAWIMHRATTGRIVERVSSEKKAA